jgi:hypothetical protein
VRVLHGRVVVGYSVIQTNGRLMMSATEVDVEEIISTSRSLVYRRFREV